MDRNNNNTQQHGVYHIVPQPRKIACSHRLEALLEKRHHEYITPKKRSASPRKNTTAQTMQVTYDYMREYQISIGLAEAWYYFPRPTNSVMCILMGGKLFTSECLPFDYVPSKFLAQLPKGLALYAFLVGAPEGIHCFQPEPETDALYKSFTFEMFDLLAPNMIYEERLRRLKRIKPTSEVVKTVDAQLIGNIYTDFHHVYAQFKAKKQNMILIRQDGFFVEKGQVKDFVELCQLHEGYGEIVGFCEGYNEQYRLLGKFKCRDVKNRKLFYVSNGIPEDMRKNYIFDRTRCIAIRNKQDYPNLGDRIKYVTISFTRKGTPCEPTFVSFERKTERTDTGDTGG
jgi:hypothetical protein